MERNLSFSEFARSFSSQLRSHALRLTGNWHQAEDLTQDTLIKLYKRWDSIDHASTPYKYAKTALLREFISSRRRLRWDREVTCGEMPEAIQFESHHTMSHDTLIALLSLGERQRTVIYMKFWEDMPVAEIASSLQISTGSVTSQSSRAVKNLRNIMVRDA